MAETTIRISAEDNASDKIKEVGKSISDLSGTLGAIGLSFAFKQMAEEGAKDETVLLALQNNIKNFSSITGVTNDSIAKVNDSFKDLGLFSENAVTEAERIVTQFDIISKDTFPTVLELSGALAAKMGIDLPQAAHMLGMSLENPQMAFRALRQVGIALNEEQKEQIKQFLAVGDTVKADAVILDAVSKATQGFTDTLKNTAAGSLKIFVTSIQNLGSEFNKTFLEILKPALDILNSAIQWFLNLDAQTKKMIETFLLLNVGLITILTSIKALSALLATNPFGLAVLGISALVSAVIALSGAFKEVEKSYKNLSTIDLGSELKKQQQVFETNAKISGVYAKSIDDLTGKLVKLQMFSESSGDVKKAEALQKQIDAMMEIEKIQKQINENSDPAIKAAQQESDKKIKTYQDYLKEIYKLQNNNDAALDIERKQELKKVEGDKAAEWLVNKKYDEMITKNKLEEFNKMLSFGKDFTNQMTSVFTTYYDGQINAAGQTEDKKKELQKQEWMVNHLAAIANGTMAIPEIYIKTMDSLSFLPPPAPQIGAGIMAGLAGAQLAALISTPMPAFATGGISPGGFIRVGETGPEAIKTNRGDKIYNENQTKQMGNGDTHLHIGNIIANNPIEFYRQLSIKTRRAESGRGVYQ